MGKLQALFLAGACAFAPQLAYSADMAPMPRAPMMEPPMLRGTVEPEWSGWYIRGDAGVSINASTVSSRFTGVGAVVPDARFDASSFGSTGFVDIGVGYQFNNWFRADIMGILRTSSAYSATESYNQGFFFSSTQAGPAGSGKTADRGYDHYGANIRSSALLVSGYFDLGTWNGLTPYIGAGVGVAMHNVSGMHDSGGVSPFQTWLTPTTFRVDSGGSGFGFAASKTSTAPAFALMTGLSWNVNERLKLEMGYRYLNMGTANGGIITCQPVANCPFEQQKFKVSSHDVHIGMRWLIDTGFSGSGSYSAAGSGRYSSGPAVSGGYAAAPQPSGQYVQGGAYSGQYAQGPVLAAPPLVRKY